MLQLVNLPYDGYTWQQWFGACPQNLRRWLHAAGCHAVEIIYGGDGPVQDFPQDLVRGYHLMFYTDWLDFWRQDVSALTEKFGSREVWQQFYHAAGREDFLRQFDDDLQRAHAAGVDYVVFHVGDVCFAETYTYNWRHTNQEIIDAAAEMINLLLDGRPYKFDFLMENLPWPGLRFDDARLTERLLSRVNYSNKGLMLDTGHLMCTEPALRDEAEAADYISRRLDEHGDLCRYIKGVHLHKSLSGEYVRQFLQQTPPVLPDDVYEQFAVTYQHILQIDRHLPLGTDAMAPVLARINPKYLVHELASGGVEDKLLRIKQQRKAMGL